MNTKLFSGLAGGNYLRNSGINFNDIVIIRMARNGNRMHASCAHATAIDTKKKKN